MAKRIFITATNTDIGKTHVTKLLLEEFASKGLSVGVFKPVETGVKDEPRDGRELFECALEHNPGLAILSLADIVPLQFSLPAAPYVANNAKPVNLDRVDKALQKIESLCDIVLIEGAGGLMVPIDKNLMVIDLIKHFEAKAVLVSHCRLGCINDTLLSIAALEHAGITHEWALNCRSGDTGFYETSAPYFADTFEETCILPDDIGTLAQKLLS